MQEISVQQLKSMRDNKEDFQLIDVREAYENDICTLNGELIPMGEVADNLDKISKDKKVIIHCRSGKRSGSIVQMLEQQGFSNTYNLKGGILAWIDEIDPGMEKY